MDPNIAKQKIAELFSLKPKFSNYFNQPIEEEDDILIAEKSIVIVKAKKDNFNRIFLISNDQEEVINILTKLKGFLVINIPAKKEITEFEQLLDNAGFVQERIYERLFNSKIAKRSDNSLIEYATTNDTKQIYDLFHNYFVSYVDYLPNMEELGKLIKSKEVIINKENDKILGAFIFEITGQKGYLRAWIDHTSKGMKLLLDAYTIFFDKGIKLAYMWADTENDKVLKIHKLLGAKPDGLKDYTFTKNTNQ